jgi:hypothetical protein
MPVGPARPVEPDPGLRFDTLAAVLATVVVTAAVIVSALVAAAMATRVKRRTRRTTRAVSNVGAAFAAAGAGPVPTTGVRLAFDRRSPALPVRSTLIGLGAAVAVVAGAFTFAASLDRLESIPGRWGYGWDLMLDTTPGEADDMIATLSADPDLDGVGLLQSNFALMRRGDRTDGTRAFGLDSTSGHVGYALLSGTQPIGPDEVVIGPGLARTAHLAIGEVAQIESCPCHGHPGDATMTPVRVVGTALFPEDDDGNFNDALGFSTVGFARHVASADTLRVAIGVTPGRDRGRVAEDLGRRFPGMVSAYSYPTRPGEVATLIGLRPFPRALAIVAALLGLAALANLLNATYQRRRREMATLRSLGLTTRSTRGCIVWQSVCVTGIAAVIGIGAGIVLGAGVWTAATRGIGVATDADRPIIAVALCLLGALGSAIGLGTLAGWRLGHLEIADSLRDE